MPNKTITEKLFEIIPGKHGGKSKSQKLYVRDSTNTLGRPEEIIQPENFGFLTSKANIYTYVYSLDDKRTMSIGPVRKAHASGLAGQTFELDFFVSYKLGDAELLATKLSEDPLNEIEKEILRVLCPPIQKLAWEQITASDRDFATLALNEDIKDHSGALISREEHLNEFAHQRGITLLQIDINRVLSEEAIAELQDEVSIEKNIAKQTRHQKADITSKAIEVEGAKQIAELQHSLDVQNLVNQKDLDKIGVLRDQETGVQRDFLNGIRTAISNAMEEPGNVNQLKNKLGSLLELMPHSLTEQYSQTGSNGTRSEKEVKPIFEKLTSAKNDVPQDLNSVLESGSTADIAHLIESTLEAHLATKEGKKLYAALLNVLAETQYEQQPGESLNKARTRALSIANKLPEELDDNEWQFVEQLLQHFESEL